MRGVRPLSPGADAETGLTPQPQEPSPDQRRDLEEPPATPGLEEPPATPGLEEPAGSASDVPTSVVYLAADSAVQLQVDDVDLLLEPDATSVLEVELPEQTIILVPEGLQAPDHHGQPGSLSASPQGGAGPEMPEDDLLVLQPGSSCQFILESSYQEESYDEDEDSGSLSPWMDPPAGQA
ncbi:proline-rich protein 23A3-like, partial [Microtus ochrogaster]|uniref:Proline-rich protein 23A3-like n=1 Tax=Microtus ochrogaster TaxID=79684 RepID=A0ABM0LIC8_MICOH